MIKKLKALDKERFQVTAEFSKFGTKTNWNGYQTPTVCFQNIKDLEGNILTDHVWFTVGKRIDSLQLQEGDIVTFEARVSGYRKGYYKDDYDYKLNNPTKLEIINFKERIESIIVIPTPEEIRFIRIKTILSFFNCRSVYDLNYLIGKKQVVKYKESSFCNLSDIKILNLPKPETPIVKAPVLISIHYLNNYNFNKEKKCYQKILK